jgi:hypothetical protein
MLYKLRFLRFLKFLQLEIVTKGSGVLFLRLYYFTILECSSEHCTEPLDYIKFWEILELSNWQLLKKGSVPWS